jgi:hypothetical protein
MNATEEAPTADRLVDIHAAATALGYSVSADSLYVRWRRAEEKAGPEGPAGTRNLTRIYEQPVFVPQSRQV